MFNFLRKPTESDNLTTGINTMNFLGGGDVKIPPRSTTMASNPGSVNIPQVPSVMAGENVSLEQGPPGVMGGNQDELPIAGTNVPSVLGGGSATEWKRPSVLPRRMGEGMDVQSKMKNWSLKGTPVYEAVRGGQAGQTNVEAQQTPPSVPGGPPAMNDQSPLMMPDNVLFGSMGNNVAKAARGWSLFNTPVFQVVQNNPVVKRSRITSKIGRVANRNGAIVGATKLRLI